MSMLRRPDARRLSGGDPSQRHAPRQQLPGLHLCRALLPGGPLPWQLPGQGWPAHRLIPRQEWCPGRELKRQQYKQRVSPLHMGGLGCCGSMGAAKADAAVGAVSQHSRTITATKVSVPRLYRLDAAGNVSEATWLKPACRCRKIQVFALISVEQVRSRSEYGPSTSKQAWKGLFLGGFEFCTLPSEPPTQPPQPVEPPLACALSKSSQS